MAELDGERLPVLNYAQLVAGTVSKTANLVATLSVRFMTSSGEIWLIDGQADQALIRRRAI